MSVLSQGDGPLESVLATPVLQLDTMQQQLFLFDEIGFQMHNIGLVDEKIWF